MNLIATPRRAFAGYHRRIVVSISCLLCVVVVSLAAYGILSDRALLLQEIENRAAYLVKNLASNSETGTFAENSRFLQTPIDAILESQDAVWAAVYTLEGTPILARQQQGYAMPALPEHAAATVRRDTHFHIHQHLPGRTAAPVLDMFYAITLRTGQASWYEPEDAAPADPELIGIARVGISLAGPITRVHSILVSTGLFGIAFLLLGVAAIFFIEKAISRPIKTLSDHARRLGQGDLDARIVIPRGDEIGDLAQAFNQMASDLHHTISELQRSQQELNDRGALLENLLESAPSAIVATDLDGTIRRFNRFAAQVLGCSKETMIGTSIIAALQPGIAPRMLDALLATPCESQHFELTGPNRAGQTITVAWATSPIKDGSGTAVGLLLIGTDMTETRRMQDQIKQAQKMEAIGTLAGGIAHDFNNVLAAIIGYAEMAIAKLPVEPASKHSFNQILTAAFRARDLVRQILAFSRNTSTQPQPVSLYRLVQDALPLLRASLPATIDIASDLQQNQVTVMADPGQMHQVIMNLGANAAQAMEATGGVLTITLTPCCPEATGDAKLPAGHYARLSIADTGTGIAPDICDRIFDPFFTTKEVGKGTGMGLAVVHGIVANHQGAITVDSAPGKGARFEILLPTIDHDPAPGDEADAPECPGGDEHILFVDDEQPIVDSYQQLLSALGYRVTGVSSSSDALERFRSHPGMFDIVITDYAMPHMDGMRLARHLRQIRPTMPILLCTGFNDALTQEQVAAAGIRRLLHKPISRVTLAREIREALPDNNA